MPDQSKIEGYICLKPQRIGSTDEESTDDADGSYDGLGFNDESNDVYEEGYPEGAGKQWHGPTQEKMLSSPLYAFTPVVVELILLQNEVRASPASVSEILLVAGSLCSALSWCTWCKPHAGIFMQCAQ